MRHKLARMRRTVMMTQDDVAHRTGMSRTSVARYEMGVQTPGVAACRKLAKLYKVSFEEIVDAIESDGSNDRPSLSAGWWSNYEVIEQSAVRILTWESMVCPGLLQVEDYAAALLGGDTEMVQRRLARQAILTRDDDPVELAAIIDESFLLRPVGGGAVLARQLDHLLALGRRSNITLQVLPLTAAALAVAIGSRTAFAIVEPSWPGGMVYLEHAGGSRSLDQLTEMENHRADFRHLQDLALPPAESGDLIRQRREELAR